MARASRAAILQRGQRIAGGLMGADRQGIPAPQPGAAVYLRRAATLRDGFGLGSWRRGHVRPPSGSYHHRRSTYSVDPRGLRPR
jgi:hypothetical protein